MPRLSIGGSLALFALLLGVSFGLQPTPAGELLLRLHTLNIAVIALVVFIGITLVRYSRNYMAGEACYPAFFRWMKLTLAAVVVTLMANHLVVFWLGWLCISLSLHRLLLLYPDRPRAVLAAHKKFLLARLSETLILAAFVLLYWVFDTAYIDQLLIAIADTGELAPREQMLVAGASMLLAAAALLKCAQLPFHGWLINIVEAPTPVSALLHAGVINLGGYLLLLFAPLIALFSGAQWLLLIGAGISAVCAALIMSTRVSVKVRLAWSTSSQMGLMLIECALGLYELALVHLLAHSVYKAFAFLNSGNTVYEHLDHRIAGLALPKRADWLKGLAVTAVVIAATMWLFGWQPALGPTAPWVLLSLSLLSLLAIRSAQNPQSPYRIAVAVTFALALSYALWKTLAGAYLVHGMPEPVAALSAMDLWACGLFLTLFAVSWAMRLWAHKPQIQRFKQALFAGLYLDEWFTRATLRLWPVSLRQSVSPTHQPATITRIGNS